MLIMSYLSDEERIKIETYLQMGLTQREIANKLNRHYNTIYNEIKRGTIIKRMYDYTELPVYDAYRGQCVQSERSHSKGTALKIGNNIELADYIENKIINEHYSPYAALQAARDYYQVDFNLRTLYSYIHKNIFLNLSSKNIKFKKKKQDAVKRTAYNNKLARSISERPASVNKRLHAGHWEMDTVVSGRGSTACLLVLTERKTRYEIIRQIPDKTQGSVISALDAIEKSSKGLFNRYFKTITCDNGVEFLDSQAIEKSIYSDTIRRTTVYYCHPFRSGERGSNENANKLIRKWFPKGCLIDTYTHEYTQHVQDWLNNYPRRLFNGLTSVDMLRREGVELII